MHCSILAPGQTLFEGEATSIRVCGSEGQAEFSIGHSPRVTLLKAGHIIVTHDGQHESFTVTGGLATVTPEATTILADVCLPTSDDGVPDVLRAERERVAHLYENGSGSEQQDHFDQLDALDGLLRTS